jgi:hypothetical protein
MVRINRCSFFGGTVDLSPKQDCYSEWGWEMMSVVIRTLLICAASMMWFYTGADQAVAQNSRWEVRSENSVARLDPFFDDNELGTLDRLELETGADSNNWFRYVKPLSGRRVWRFEQQARARVYNDRDELNSLLFSPRVQYWAPIGSGWQMRAIADSSVLMRDGNGHYTRYQAEGQLRSRSQDGTELVFRARVSQYDFGKQVVAGLDQNRLRFGVQRNSSRAAQSGTRLSAFLISSEAQLDNFSFVEWRAEAVFWTKMSENTEVSLSFLTTQRDYDGTFSVSQPFARNDTRMSATARVEHALSERSRIFAALGYLDNDSNISQREYAGVTFRLGARFDFR